MVLRSMETGDRNSGRRFSESQVGTAILLLAVGLLLQAFVPIFMKLSELEINPNAIIFHRFWIATVCLFIWDGFRAVFRQTASPHASPSEGGRQCFYPPAVVGWLLLLGSVYTLNQFFWAWSLTQTRVASLALTYGLTPVLAMVGEWLFLRKSFNAKYLAGMAIAIAGLGIVAFSDWQLQAEQLQGDAIAVMGTVCFSAYLLIVPRLRLTLSAKSIFFWRCAITTCLALPIAFVVRDRFLPASFLGWFSLLGLTATAIGQLLLIYSLKVLSPSFVAIFLLLDPFIASAAARLIFSEPIGTSTWIAMAIISLGVYVCTIDAAELAVLTDSD